MISTFVLVSVVTLVTHITNCPVSGRQDTFRAEQSHSPENDVDQEPRAGC